MQQQRNDRITLACPQCLSCVWQCLSTVWQCLSVNKVHDCKHLQVANTCSIIFGLVSQHAATKKRSDNTRMPRTSILCMKMFVFYMTMFICSMIMFILCMTMFVCNVTVFACIMTMFVYSITMFICNGAGPEDGHYELRDHVHSWLVPQTWRDWRGFPATDIASITGIISGIMRWGLVAFWRHRRMAGLYFAGVKVSSVHVWWSVKKVLVRMLVSPTWAASFPATGASVHVCVCMHAHTHAAAAAAAAAAVVVVVVCVCRGGRGYCWW